MYNTNQKVTTPYGEGIYLGLSDDPEIIKVQPTTWTMARETKPTFFMNPKDVKPLYSIGTPVFLTYGNGTIIEYRESDNMYTVELLNWKLAQGQSPSLYLQECSLSTVPIIVSKAKEDSLAVEDIPKPPGPSYADTCITNAIVIKEEAGTFYKKMDYQTAKEKYLKALEAIQVRHYTLLLFSLFDAFSCPLLLCLLSLIFIKLTYCRCFLLLSVLSS